MSFNLQLTAHTMSFKHKDPLKKITLKICFGLGGGGTNGVVVLFLPGPIDGKLTSNCFLGLCIHECACLQGHACDMTS